MKRISLLLTASLLFLSGSANAQTTKSSGEEVAISQVAREYFDAWNTGNVEKMKTVLHPKARLFMPGTDNKDLVAQTPEQLYKNFKSNIRYTRDMPPRPKGTLKIERIDVTGDAATARVEMDYSGFKVIHQFSLMRFADGWKIVSRVSCVDLPQTQAKLE
jgi:hypothetical protein